jgi:hypothetical protein
MSLNLDFADPIAQDKAFFVALCLTVQYQHDSAKKENLARFATFG